MSVSKQVMSRDLQFDGVSAGSTEATSIDGSSQHSSNHNSPRSALCPNDTASWPSVAIDMFVRRRHVASSFDSGADCAVASFGSAVTDFDDLICPGAQAENNAAYLEAVRQSHVTPGLSAFGFPGLMQMPENGSAKDLSTENLRAQAADLEFMAAQMMAKAYEAKAQALRAQSTGYGEGNSPVAVAAPMVLVPQMVYPASVANTLSGGQVPQKSGKPIDVSKPSNAFQAHGQAKSKCVADYDKTTVILRNVPNDYTRDMFLDLLNSQGFAGCYDFVYLPADMKRKAGLGYGFVNMCTHDDALRVFDILGGFSSWQKIKSAKRMEVGWGDPLQGLEAHVNRYRNSPVMHEDAPREYRPLLFKHGVEVEFPPPTRKLRAPRIDFRNS